MNKRQYKKQYKKYCKAFDISYSKIAKVKKQGGRLTMVQSSFDAMVTYYLRHKKYMSYKSMHLLKDTSVSEMAAGLSNAMKIIEEHMSSIDFSSLYSF